jgi:hypothetical protein
MVIQLHQPHENKHQYNHQAHHAASPRTRPLHRRTSEFLSWRRHGHSLHRIARHTRLVSRKLAILNSQVESKEAERHSPTLFPSSSQQAGTTRNSMPVSLSRSSSHILYARWAPQIPCSFLEGARSETNEVILRKQDRASHSVDLYMTMFYFTNTSKLKYGELGLQSRRVARRKCIPGLSYLALNRKRNGVSASATCGL